MKSPAQVLFDRLFRTWIEPDIAARQKSNPGIGPIPFRLALIVWQEPSAPKVLLNEEVFGQIRKMEIVSAGPVAKGQPVMSADIAGLTKVILTGSIASCPYVAVVQGRGEKFYVKSNKMGDVVGIGDFEALSAALAREGLVFGGEHHVNVFLDLRRNLYESMPTSRQKRKELDNIASDLTSKADAIAKAERYLRLPTLIVHPDDEFLPLLLEARATYVDGHYFSCVASAVTTADRICVRLMHRVGLRDPDNRRIVKLTFGQKVQPLRSRHIITAPQEALLGRLNRIRTRHVHARKTPSELTSKRDALAAIRLLHEFLEGTFSVFRDYRIEDGRLVPKPLI